VELVKADGPRLAPRCDTLQPWPARAASLNRRYHIQSGLGIIGWIVIGILAGWIAEKVMKRNHGLLTNLVVGVVGAILGGFVAGPLGIGANGLVMSLVIATAGAILLLFLLSVVRRRR
jgi:uncharacterized membrane protein YeaQ/YmgE (transglycosylase-associated protein family)